MLVGKFIPEKKLIRKINANFDLQLAFFGWTEVGVYEGLSNHMFQLEKALQARKIILKDAHT